MSQRKPTKKGLIIDFEKDNESTIIQTLKKRRSCRSFSEEKLTLSQIGNICHCAYSINDHSVPSGGALYPLKIYVLIEEDQLDITSGYYEYDAENDKLVLFSHDVDIERLKFCFNQDELPFESSVQIIIAADLDRQTYKYANRGYRLTLIEVGHVAENINLYCEEQGLGACEMGGIQDLFLKTELKLEDNIYPIIAIPIGYKAKDPKPKIDELLFVERIVDKPDSPIIGVEAKTFGKDSDFFCATCAFKGPDGKTRYSGGTSTSYVNAVFKATIEGCERWASSQIRIDYYGEAKNLVNWVHPYDIAPLTLEQTLKCGLNYFDESLPLNWTIGINWDGAEIFVPSDLVFYGYRNEEDQNRIYFGNSSGVAAFTFFEEARKRAVVELIERDALMRNWYCRKSPRIIAKRLLPVHGRSRSDYWKMQGRKVFVLEMPSSYGWVFETIIVSKEYPYFVSGAAATIEETMIPNAINKSLQEAEYKLLSWRERQIKPKIEPSDVKTASNHGELYSQEDYAATLSWLWSGEETKSFSNLPNITIETLIKELQIVTINVTKPDSEIVVVRAMSPKLIPMSFGCNLAHFSHPALQGKIHPESLVMPHYFA